MPSVSDTSASASLTAVKTLPLLVLADRIAFPGAELPLHLTEPGSLQLVRDIMSNEGLLVLTAWRTSFRERPGKANLYDVGCIARLGCIESQDDESAVVTLDVLD
ncbi:MAG: ATP-dependent protease La substrate-binding domain, partial [Candidatus Hydrogenedentes bacterium]|nr:ATP-dependent protease La substrate-binding domain [Candidatus Hydrogenedentota bacterium]